MRSGLSAGGWLQLHWESHPAFKQNEKFGRCEPPEVFAIVGLLIRESFGGEREQAEQAHA
jgi:hypothetical protein